jgi:UDP-GlcNAc3NAcA epimerase
MHMPEEINRMLTDKLSTYLFCPTDVAVKNLQQEGMREGIYNVGDVMYDAALFFGHQATQQCSLLSTLNLKRGEFVLATCHRAENTDDKNKLSNILMALAKIANDLPVVFPLHPRTLASINHYGLSDHLQNIRVIAPVSYLDMVSLEQSAQVILTDSGGVQKEAFFYGVPCITMREETEWVETVTLGWNQIVGTDQKKIYSAFLQAKKGRNDYLPYGDGRCSRRIMSKIVETQYA